MTKIRVKGYGKPHSEEVAALKKALLALVVLVPLLGLSYVNPDYQSPIVAVVKECAPAVVKIDVVRYERVPFFDPFTDEFFRKFFGDTPWGYQREVRALGSGFIFDKRGYIITNEHVVHKAKEIEVTLLDGSKYKAEYIGGDEELDIAIIKIDPKGKDLPTLELGDSDKVEIGEWAIAIGNPLGFQHTVTIGVVSALHRKIPKPDGSGYYTNLIQTDAAINPGNSGGPLLNIHGQVIGVNTAIINPMQGVNLGFAIPINTVKRFIDSLIKTGRAEKAYLGVRIMDVTEAMKKALKLGVDHGAIVTEVMKGSPADQAGIKAGDVIIKVDEVKINSAAELVSVIHSYSPGNKVKIVVVRKGKELSFDVVLGKYSEEAQKELSKPLMGIHVDEIQPGDRETYSIPEGVKGVIVRKVEDTSLGVKVGDVITAIAVNGRETEIRSLKDWNKVVSKLKEGDYLALYIIRKNARLILAFPYVER